jgi:hypothetical protein
MTRLTFRRPRWGRLAAGVLAVAVVLVAGSAAWADRLEFNDGRVIEKCFVRDEGVRYMVWEKMADVGGPAKVYPRSHVKSVKIDRDDAWDVHPALPDLSVTFIELNPKLAGLHANVFYDQFSRVKLSAENNKLIPDLGGEKAYMDQQEAGAKLKLKHAVGEEITLTAHVKNVGFAEAKPFKFVWLIDKKELAQGECPKALKEMEEATFELKWKWEDGFHSATFRIVTDQAEIATLNNEVTDPLWGWGYWFYVEPGRVKAWHQVRSASGTFSFEDYYRWHVDIMNTLFAASVFPAAPEGIKARVRLDRIIYTDDVEAAGKNQRSSEDGIIYHQGAWIWQNEEDKKKEWKLPDKQGRNSTEWSLPHELGHQLGLTDWYYLDYDGSKDVHKWPDTGNKIAHFMTHADTMMHWHGPHIWSEVDAGYLNMTYDKPRGHFGDYYYAMPKECFLSVQDVNGQGVPAARVEIYQRGTEVDPKGQGGEDQGIKWFPVVEDGNFEKPVSKDPVMVGTTDAQGMMRLANRPVKEVISFNGYHREPNPFGNLNVCGERGLMLVKVTRRDRVTYYWLEAYGFVAAWFRGQKDKYVTVLRTPYGSVGGPMPPRSVRLTQGGWENEKVRLAWDAPEIRHEQHFLERAVGFHIYRRFGESGLNDRPWTAVAVTGPTARSAVIELKDKPEDIDWFQPTHRFGVSTIGEDGMESEIVEVFLPVPKKP